MEYTIQRLASSKGALAVLIGLILLGCVPDAAAKPVAVANAEGAEITLYDDKCQLKEVSNLPMRSEWKEKGKTYEGCWSAHPSGLIVAYFAGDKTVALIPARAFEKVSAI